MDNDWMRPERDTFYVRHQLKGDGVYFNEKVLGLAFDHM
jgi:hypothetical protein